eukprot:138768-Prorocentrum_minimum.AAC.5
MLPGSTMLRNRLAATTANNTGRMVYSSIQPAQAKRGRRACGHIRGWHLAPRGGYAGNPGPPKPGDNRHAASGALSIKMT